VEVSELPRFCTPLHAFNAHACMTGLHRIMVVQSLRTSSGTVPAQVSGEQHPFPDVFCAGELHQNALNTESPSGVRGYAVTESFTLNLSPQGFSPSFS